MILGVHVSKVSNILDNKTEYELDEAINRDLDILGLNAAQIFTFGPRQLKPNVIPEEAVKNATKNISLMVHSAYAATGIWKANSENMKEYSNIRQFRSFDSQMRSCKRIDAWGLVLHIPKIYPDEAVKTMKLIKPIASKTGVKILLEMIAQKADPNKTYETPEKINNLTTLLDPEDNRWGWVIDTAHIWGAGIDIKSYESMHDWLERLAYKKKILLFHLNGSSAELGSGHDKHEIIFSPTDLIWYNIDPFKSGVFAIIQFAKKYKIPIILEINRGLQSYTEQAIKILLNMDAKIKN